MACYCECVRDRGQVASVGGVQFAVTQLGPAVDETLNAAITGQPIAVRLANAYCVALAERNPSYLGLLNDKCGVTFPDGTPVAWFLRLRAPRQGAGTVRGPSLFVEALKRSQDTSVKHFFVGTTSETLCRLTTEISTRFPRVHIAGSWAPPFAPLSEELLDEITNRVHESGANLVWVGMGTPKQDHVARELVLRENVTSVGVGAAFDFLAGTVREAPTWVQNTGFEWAYRLASEPRRLWKRYLIGNVTFLKAALRSRSDT